MSARPSLAQMEDMLPVESRKYNGDEVTVRLMAGGDPVQAANIALMVANREPLAMQFKYELGLLIVDYCRDVEAGEQ